eukprot:2736944-Heterocapsa_arctica.AAC.1
MFGKGLRKGSGQRVCCFGKGLRKGSDVLLFFPVEDAGLAGFDGATGAPPPLSARLRDMTARQDKTT